MQSAIRLVPMVGLLFATACAATAAVERPPPRTTRPVPDDDSNPGYAASMGPTPGGPGVGSVARLPTILDTIPVDGSPCQGCSIDPTGRFRGSFRGDVETCGDREAKLFYPVRSPVIQVLRGDQAGEFFPIGDRSGEIPADTVIDTTLGEEARPEGWRSAIVWVTDATNRRCASALAILRP